MAGCQDSPHACTSPHMQRYPLKERDIVKFGKQKIKIREIVLNDNNPSIMIEPTIKTEKKIYDDLKLKIGG